MSRPRQDDRTQLPNPAMDLFHRRGFDGASTAELSDEPAVDRESMYAEFGSKQVLFDPALNHYDATSASAGEDRADRA